MGRHRAQPVTAPAHTRLVGYRQQKMDSAKMVIHGRQQSCDVLPFSSPPPIRGHYTPKAVSREKVKKLGGVAQSSPSTRLWVGMFWQTDPCRKARLPDCIERWWVRGAVVQEQAVPERRANRRSTSTRIGAGPAPGNWKSVAPRNAVGSGLRFNFSDASIRLHARGSGASRPAEAVNDAASRHDGY